MPAVSPAHAAAPGAGGVTITYLEMLAPPATPPRPAPKGVQVRRAAPPGVPFYRWLYDAVGAAWNWTDRRALSDEALAANVQHPDVAVHVLYHHGVPAGYAEWDYRRRPAAQLVYFGLLPGHIGQGLGGFFLDWAVRQAWQQASVGRLWVHTCSLDHPRALGLYQRCGFRIYKAETKPAA